jgi:hypothetical protein
VTRTSRNLDSGLAAWLIAGLAALCVLTACGGPPGRPVQGPGGTADVAEAPAPRDVPQQPPGEKRDVVRTASMIVVTTDPAEAADKAAVTVENAQGRVDSRSEDALSERQAELDSLRAQREALGDRIEYSTLNVAFVAQSIGGPASDDYRGFFGQVERGWDALVSVVGNLILLFGLLLPWLGVLAVTGGIGYVVVRLVKRGRR